MYILTWNSRQSVLVFDVFVHIECKYVLNRNKNLKTTKTTTNKQPRYKVLDFVVLSV